MAKRDRSDHNLKISRRAVNTGLFGSIVMAASGAYRVPGALAAALPDLKGRDPKTLVVAVDAAVDNLDPATNLEWAYGLQPVYDTLLGLKPGATDETVPNLALTCVPNDDSSLWSISLRPGVVFHDGSPCNADAVKRSIVRLISVPTGAGYVWSLDDPEAQITVKGELELEINAGSPRPLLPLELASQYNFWIASPEAAEKNSTGPDDLGNAFLRANPVGTGPYKFERLDPGSEYIVSRNEDYWGGGPSFFEKVVTRTIPVAGTQRQLLEDGAVDIMFGARAEMVRELEADDRFVVTDQPTMTMQYVALGRYGPLADPRARQAMNHAFDSAAYVRDIELDTHTPPTSAFPSLLHSADSEVGVLEFDLAKAKALFEEAGVSAGTELSYVFYTEFGNLAGELLQAWLAEIGIKLVLMEKSFSGFLGDYFSDAAPEDRPSMYFFSWWPNVDHPYSYAFQMFHSGAAGSLGGNAGFYRNEEVDGLIDSLYQVPRGTPELLSTSRRIQEIVTREDPAQIPILEERTHLAYRRDIAGLDLNPIQVLTLDMKALGRTD